MSRIRAKKIISSLRRQVGAVAFEDFGGHADRLAQRRVRMDGLAYVRGFAAHFDCQAHFADQVARMGADNPAADHAMRCFVEDQLGETLVAAVGDRPSRRGPREHRAADLDALGLALLLGLAGPCHLGVGIGH